MDEKRIRYLRGLFEEFKSSGLTEADYCVREGLERSWFDKQRRALAAHEGWQQRKTSPEGNAASSLFVELEKAGEAIETKDEKPASAKPLAPAVALRATCRDVSFDLAPGFDVVTFSRALQAVREAC